MGDVSINSFIEHVIGSCLSFIPELTQEHADDFDKYLDSCEDEIWDYRQAYFRYMDERLNTDWRRFAKYGMTREIMDGLYQALSKLRKLLILPLNIEDPENINQISLPYYTLILSDLEKSVENINIALRAFPKEFLVSEQEISYTFIMDSERKTIDLKNPYHEFVNNRHIADDFIQYIKDNSQGVDLSRLVYMGFFTKIQNIISSLKEKNISSDDFSIFVHEYGSIITYGFAMHFVHYKLSQADRMSYLEDNFIKTEEEAFLYDQYFCLFKYSSELLKISIPINFEALGDLYQKHQGDDIGIVLKPFIEDFVPEFKSFLPPTGNVKLLTYWANHFAPLEEAYHKKKIYIQDKSKFDDPRFRGKTVYAPLYFHKFMYLLPISITDAPSKKYEELFRLCLENTQENHFTSYRWRDLNTEQRKAPKGIDEIDNMDTLNQQKLWMAWYMAYKCEYLPPDVAGLVGATLPWRIDDESEEAREIERRVNYFFKGCGQYLSDSFSKNWYKFLSQSVWDATEPLDPNLIKEKMIVNNNVTSDFEGCCSVQ